MTYTLCPIRCPSTKLRVNCGSTKATVGEPVEPGGAVCGRGIQYIYDDAGNVIDEVLLEAGGPCSAMSVELGVWHRLESLESGTVIFESKDGAYEPLGEEDILKV